MTSNLALHQLQPMQRQPVIANTPNQMIDQHE